MRPDLIGHIPPHFDGNSVPRADDCLADLAACVRMSTSFTPPCSASIMDEGRLWAVTSAEVGED